MRALIVLAALVATLAGAGPAFAGSVSVKIVVRGAGSVTADTDGGARNCQQDPPVSNDAEEACTGWLWTDPQDTDHVAGLAMKAVAPKGWAFDHWEKCDQANGPYCLERVAKGVQRDATATAVFLDSARPEINGLVVVKNADGTRSAIWTASEPGVRFGCTVDGQTDDCASPYTLRLAQGTHEISVTGKDLSQQDSLPQRLTFAVIDTALTVAPAEGAHVNSASSPFVAATKYGTAFECSLDDGAWVACGTAAADGTSPLTLPAVSDGPHKLSVRARRGNDVDPLPPVRHWVVDTVAPETTITPLDGGAFKFTANEQATFRCRLDGGPSVPCSDPLGVIPYGAHTLEATATDEAGNSDPTPAVYRWTTTAPPAPTPTPTPVVTPSTPVVPAAPAADNRLPDVASLTVTKLELSFTFRDGRFTRIATNAATVTITRPGKRAARITLKQLAGSKLANGTRITFRLGASSKALAIRRGKAV